MARDTGIDAHRQWLGYVQPSGLVVSIPALLEANARLDQNYAPSHRRFLSALPARPDGEPVPEILNFPAFAETVFEWRPEDLYGAPGAPALPQSLEIALPDYHETLRPTYALRDFEPAGANGVAARPAGSEWILLVQVLARETDFDKIATSDDRHWQATPQAKFERLLRQAHVPIGLLVNDRQIRLVYAPEKELSGHITFNLADMVTVAGRPIFSALFMLLNENRLFSMGRNERLPAILENSRKYQNTVSTQLASQVVEALYVLLRGFQAADDSQQGELMKDVLARDPEEVYRGLLTTLLRLVFILYAEDRGLLSSDPLFANHYSLAGLYERLRADDGRYHDTMGQRYGAWAQLLVLFRLIHSGARHEAMNIPAREGYLFDPERYRFLEGRVHKQDKVQIPRVSDGVIFNVLTKLRVLDGERLSYRTLAVEQIGSVYQAIMGFGLEQAKGRSIAIKSAKKHGAPATINLEELLRISGEKRGAWFKDQTDQKLSGKAADDLKQAASMEELLMALERKIALEVTPSPVPKGAMIFQPSDERRRSGSHYTPSSLTGPIVEAALEPVLQQLGEKPTPAQILNLKVCDLAMGSAAFLVEACRQLGDALVQAWHAHNEVPQIPLDEDEALFAQRLVSQRCLYGLDKNQMAADLAKLSLWLATLAKDHPFTFLDHSLRHGDALVGLTRKQIAAFNWAPAAQQSFFEEKVRSVIDRVSEYRQRILNARDNTPYAKLVQELGNADDWLSIPRMIGDAVVASFFSAEKPKQREETRMRFAALIEANLKKEKMIPVGGEVDLAVKELQTGEKPTPPFHWELEFPEVFTTDKSGNVTGGFDLMVGNPPFLGGTRISAVFGMTYFSWLTSNYPPAGHLCDLVAYLFRRSFALLRNPGVMGMIATNTISQGDTRNGGLTVICKSGGEIYRVIRRYRWPGQVAVVVCIIHISKGFKITEKTIDGRRVDQITAFLFHQGGHDDPVRLAGRNELFSAGSKIYGQGFLFADDDDEATPIEEMHRILDLHPESKARVLPYMGGNELNSDPTLSPHRYVIYLSDIEDEKDLAQWPELAEIVRRKVKPGRDLLGSNPNNIPLKKRWWAYQAHRPRLYSAMEGMSKVLLCSQVTPHLAFAFKNTGMIFSQKLNVFLIEEFAPFAILQSRVHEIWSRFCSSTSLELLSYTPSDSFETFPMPLGILEPSKTKETSNPPLDEGVSAMFRQLGEIGMKYYDRRADVMVRNSEGLTDIYNRFHEPEENSPETVKLRELHDAMDRAVLDAYGWTDIRPNCEFIPEFDDEDDEDDSSRQKKKKYRYRWPDEIRDEVLALLLELNRQRAKEEGQMVEPLKQKTAKKRQAATPLFEE
jgi:hypothetical protein